MAVGAGRTAELRRPVGVDLAAIAVAALLSGAPSTAHSLVTGRPTLATVRAAASLVRPRRGSDDDGGSAASLVGDLVAGGIAHGLVSLFWGTVLARLLPRGRRAAWGAAAGVAVHVVDLGVIARVIPRLAPMRQLPQLPQLGDHVAFGFILGLLLDRWDPPPSPSPMPASPTPAPIPGRDEDQATSSSAAG